jgi:hypothetical protein
MKLEYLPDGALMFVLLFAYTNLILMALGASTTHSARLHSAHCSE